MTDEQRAARLHYHMYESLEGIQEHAERIVELEDLCVQRFNCCHGGCVRCKIVTECAEAGGDRCILWFRLEDQMRKLGIEVES